MKSYKYLVTIRPGLSIGPKEYNRIISLEHLEPLKAVVKVSDQLATEENQLWQSDEVTVTIKRVY